MAKKICAKCELRIEGLVHSIKGMDYCFECSRIVYREEIEKEYPTPDKKLVGIIGLLDMVNDSLQRQEDQVSSLKSSVAVLTLIMIISFIAGFFQGCS